MSCENLWDPTFYQNMGFAIPKARAKTGSVPHVSLYFFVCYYNALSIAKAPAPRNTSEREIANIKM